jgi:hypothetical protein
MREVLQRVGVYFGLAKIDLSDAERHEANVQLSSELTSRIVKFAALSGVFAAAGFAVVSAIGAGLGWGSAPTLWKAVVFGAGMAAADVTVKLLARKRARELLLDTPATHDGVESPW